MNNFNQQYQNTILDEKSNFKSALLSAMLLGSQPIISDVEAKSPPSITQSQNMSIGQKKYNPSEVRNIIARTLWAEAKGEGEKGMRAVASVIYNRASGNVNKMVPVIKKPKQFSCWNKMKEKDWFNFEIKEKSGPAWDLAKKIATEMATDNFSPILDSDHYYNPSLCTPNWSKIGKIERPSLKIGRHKFMKINER
jgi:N-acetylmuramoyl-L-alanine amidase